MLKRYGKGKCLEDGEWRDGEIDRSLEGNRTWILQWRRWEIDPDTLEVERVDHRITL